MGVTEFGQRPENVTVHQRSCVYGVALDTREWVLVARFKGRLVLPGGGIDPGESELEALERETLEETGYQVEIGALIGRARQWVNRVETGKFRDKMSAFYRLDAARRLGPPTDPRHEAMWLPSDQVVGELSYESHRWAVLTVRQ